VPYSETSVSRQPCRTRSRLLPLIWQSHKPIANQTDDEKNIQALALKCKETSKEILDLLDKIKGKKLHSYKASLGVVLKGARKKIRIEMLQEKLSQLQDQLQLQLTVVLRCVLFSVLHVPIPSMCSTLLICHGMAVKHHSFSCGDTSMRLARLRLMEGSKCSKTGSDIGFAPWIAVSLISSRWLVIFWYHRSDILQRLDTLLKTRHLDASKVVSLRNDIQTLRAGIRVTDLGPEVSSLLLHLLGMTTEKFDRKCRDYILKGISFPSMKKRYDEVDAAHGATFR